MNRSIKISEHIYKKIKACANKEKRTLKAILEISVCQYLQKKVLER